MRRLQLLALFTALLFSAPALSQTNTIVNFKNGTNSTQVSAANPLPITGSFSAGTFAPGGAYATLTATASSADAALPAGTSVIAFNTGTTAVSCSLSVGAGTALANQNIIQASSGLGLVVGSNTHIACIDQTGSASNLVVVSGGSGSPSGAGGGGGSGGAVTLASGAVSSGAYSSGSIASGAYASGAFASGAAASGSWSDGSIVTLGAKADTACSVAPCSVIGWLGQIHNDAAAGTVAIGAAPPASGIYVAPLVSGATGGLAGKLISCDQTATYDASTSGSTLLKAGVTGRKFYICGFIITTGSTATNVKLTEGTTVTTPCDTGAANVTPAFQLAANDKVGANAATWNGLGTATAADNLCINANAGNAVQAIVWFAIL